MPKARHDVRTTTALAPRAAPVRPGHSLAAVAVRQPATMPLARLAMMGNDSIVQRKPASTPAGKSASKTVGYLHRVEKGETVASLARTYGVTTSAIMRWNRDQLGAVQPGWTLTLPSNAKGASVHKVDNGQYLWSIAKLYVGADDLHKVNIFVDAMLAANLELLASNNLKAGATIKIATDGKREDDEREDDEREDRGRGVDAAVSIPIMSGTRPIKFKNLRFDLDWSLKATVATDRGKAVEVSPDGMQLKLQELVGRDIDVGLKKDGTPTITGGMASRFGSARIGIEGKNMIVEYQPLAVPFSYKGGRFKGKFTLEIVAKPRVSAMYLVKRASRGKVSKYVARLLLRRLGIRLAKRGTVMAVLAAIDGPLPFGELIDLGIGIWTIVELLMEISSIMKQAEICATQEARTGTEASCR